MKNNEGKLHIKQMTNYILDLNDKVAQFKQDLKKTPTNEIYTKYVLAGEVWVFKKKYNDKWFENYNDFKLYISKRLGVHYNDIAIAGSAKLGFSVNPKKKFKLFNEESDIDVVIISQELFYLFWKEYLEDSYSPIGIEKIGKISFGIFRKYIFLDGFRNENKFFRQWEVKTKGFEKDLQLLFGIENDIHYRIFESWDSAQKYYVNGIDKCKNDMIEGEEK